MTDPFVRTLSAIGPALLESLPISDQLPSTAAIPLLPTADSIFFIPGTAAAMDVGVTNRLTPAPLDVAIAVSGSDTALQHVVIQLVPPVLNTSNFAGSNWPLLREVQEESLEEHARETDLFLLSLLKRSNSFQAAAEQRVEPNIVSPTIQ